MVILAFIYPDFAEKIKIGWFLLWQDNKFCDFVGNALKISYKSSFLLILTSAYFNIITCIPYKNKQQISSSSKKLRGQCCKYS